MTDKTKAELIAELALLEDENGRLRKSVPNPPARVEEADALAQCVRALDQISDRKSSFYGYQNAASEDVKRILTHLASKYHVNLIDIREQPCSRPHLDNVNPSRLIDALRGSAIAAGECDDYQPF